MSDFDFSNDSMLEMYLFESSTLLDQLDGILLQSEKEENIPHEDVDEIFRIMHTIKGSSAMMEFETITHVSHKLEDLFFIIRDKGIDGVYFHELFDLLLSASDFLKEEIDKIKENQKLSPENDLLISEISTLIDKMNGSSNSDLPATASETDSLPKEEVDQDLSFDFKNTYFLHVHFAADCQMENIRAFMLVNKLEPLGKIIETLPEDLNTNKDASSIISQNGFYCSFSSDLSKSEVEVQAKSTLSVERVAFIQAMPMVKKAGATATTSTKEKPSTDPESKLGTQDASPDNNTNSYDSSSSSKSKAKQNLINVDLNKLDTLMDLVGEIVITESMVSGNADLIGLELDSFNKTSRQLRKLTDELQDIVMSIRMVPIASTFQKMQRIVRDMSKKLDKDVDLVFMGEGTEVDKTIIDGIADPLMHVVRNAMDHAIEDKADRKKANKDPLGKIILSAQNVGGDIVISISDDGKGLDSQALLEKAKEKNLLIKPEGDYTEKEIFNLLTLPGFSTKDAVTEFSGRGVGMDVVKKNIEKIGGSVNIQSEKGSGTNIFFKIPLTLAIITSIEIRIGAHIYDIPITNIRESFKATQDQLLSDPDGNEMIMIRGVCYPIIRLHKIFSLEGNRSKIEDGILLLVDSGDRLACLFADELVGKHQVVVKPLPLYLSRYARKSVGIAGCTIIGDGSISMILDIQGILNQY